ncbi:MAG: 1,4-dihydroxy-2-naphthoyl-CoA synthase [Propionibacteriaceae bacterium]|jgi:naphthoate synthase|nr:1,4-dihydroxy-2-naphthoyl-CoA synthase [Propionibacteriaceae bacterium]
MEQPFHSEDWTTIDGFDFQDVTYHRAKHVPAVRVAINRPEVRNAFRPQTVDELHCALDHARTSPDIACVLLTGNGPSEKDGGWAFCSGGDQRVRGKGGYEYQPDDQEPRAAGQPVAAAVGQKGEPGGEPPTDRVRQAQLGRLHILEVQRLIRFMPKPVIALVNGWAAGGGHSLAVVCDLTLASREHARFKQTDADVGSFDAGFGSAYLARQVGQKFAREIFFLGQTYDAAQGHAMGTVNAVVPHGDLERVGLEWADLIAQKSPTAIRMLKYAFNAIDDGLIGQQLFAGETTRLAYMTDEAREGRDSFLEKRPPDWSDYPYYY